MESLGEGELVFAGAKGREVVEVNRNVGVIGAECFFHGSRGIFRRGDLAYSKCSRALWIRAEVAKSCWRSRIATSADRVPGQIERFVSGVEGAAAEAFFEKGQGFLRAGISRRSRSARVSGGTEAWGGRGDAGGRTRGGRESASGLLGSLEGSNWL